MPNSQKIPGNQDLKKIYEMEVESILNEEWPDKKRPSKTSVNHKIVSVGEDEENSNEEEENEENEKKHKKEKRTRSKNNKRVLWEK